MNDEPTVERSGMERSERKGKVWWVIPSENKIDLCFS